MSNKKNDKDNIDIELFEFDKTADLSVRYLRESYNAAKCRAAELSTNGGLTLNLRGHSQQAIRIYSALATLLYATISISKADDLERFVKKRSFQVPKNLFDIEEWGPVLKIARTVRIGEMAKYQDELASYKSHISANVCQIFRLAKALVSSMRATKRDSSNELHLLRTELQSLRSSVIPLVQGKLIDLEQRNTSLLRESEFKDQTIARVTESEQMAKKTHLSELELFERRQSQEMQTIKLKHEADVLAIEKKHRAELDDLVGQHKRAMEEIDTRRQSTELALRAQLSNLEQSKTAEYEGMDADHKLTLQQLETDMRRQEKQYQDTIAMNKASLQLAAEKLRRQDNRLETAEMEIEHLKQSLESLITENNSNKARCSDCQEQVVILTKELTNTKEKLDLKCKELRDVALANEEEICQKEGQFGSLLSKLFEAERVNSEMKKANEKKIKALEANVLTMRNSLREMEHQKENELCAKESSFGSLLSKLFEAERVIGAMKKEHEVEKKALERRLSIAVHDETSNSQYIREKYTGLKARVIKSDVQVVASFFTEWVVHDTVARVCAYQDAPVVPVENGFVARSTSFNVGQDAENFDDVAFCKYITENIISESTKKAINKTVQVLNDRVTELTVEVGILRNEDSSLRDELQLCMDELRTSLDDVDSLKNENAKVSSALRDCQEQLSAADASYKNVVRRNEEIQQNYEAVSKELEQCQRFLSDSSGLLEAMRTRERELVEDLDIAIAARESEKCSFNETRLCENVVSRALKESLHNVIEKQLMSKLQNADEYISELQKENMTLKESLLSGASNQTDRTVDTVAVVSSEREEELQNDIADCRKEIATKESELAAVNTRLCEREHELEQEAATAKRFAEREAELYAEVATVRAELEVKEQALLDIARKNSENLHLTQQAEKRIIRLQAVARGFNARSLTRRMRIIEAAKSSGVLVALRQTVQGETGWYCGPDGSLYYFVLDEGEWLLTCGPISREQLDVAVSTPGGVNVQMKKNPKQRYLKYCDFELVAKAIDFQGDVFISPQTWKLFFAISVESLMVDSK